MRTVASPGLREGRVFFGSCAQGGPRLGDQLLQRHAERLRGAVEHPRVGFASPDSRWVHVARGMPASLAICC